MSGSAPLRPRPTPRVAPPVHGVGMIAPANPLVQVDGTPTPVTFRFLAELYREIAMLKTRLADAGIP